MNKVNNAVLTQIVRDWQKQFPSLKRYKSGQKLLKRAGPVIIGIELEKFYSSKYRPRLILVSLIDNNSSTFVNVIDQTLRTEKNLELTIEYKNHSEEYLRACDLVHKQARVSLSEELTLSSIINGILESSESDPHNPYWSCEAVMHLALLLENQNKAEAYFQQATSLMVERIPSGLLEEMTGGLEKWIEAIRSLDHDAIQAKVEESIEKRGLDKIPLTEISYK